MYLLERVKLMGFSSLFITAEISMSIALVVDVIFTFRTAYFTEREEMIADTEVIFKNYLKSFFLPDLLSSFPADLIFNYDGNVKNVYAICLLKTPRLLRFLKVIRRSSIPDQKYGAEMEVFRMFCLYYLIAHYFACVLCYNESIIIK
jgi:hypothetical protein